MTETGIIIGLIFWVLFSVAVFIIRERRSDKEFIERLKRKKDEDTY